MSLSHEGDVALDLVATGLVWEDRLVVAVSVSVLIEIEHSLCDVGETCFRVLLVEHVVEQHIVGGGFYLEGVEHFA